MEKKRGYHMFLPGESMEEAYEKGIEKGKINAKIENLFGVQAALKSNIEHDLLIQFFYYLKKMSYLK